MGRLYVPSTPATRGEPAPEAEQVQVPEPVVLTVDDLRAAAAEHGFELVPVGTGSGQSGSQGSEQSGSAQSGSTPSGQQHATGQSSQGQQGLEQPAGNGSTEKWVEYAKAKGATDADLLGADGEPLNRDELKAKYGTPTGS